TAVGHVLDLAVLQAGPLGASPGLLGGRGQAADFLLRGSAAAAGGGDHAAQPRQALRAAGRGAGRVGPPALGGGEGRLGGGPFGGGGGERLAPVAEPLR